MGRKVSDAWTVPLCAIHHRSLHTVGDEEKWWKARQIDPLKCAEQLWCQRRVEGVDLSTRAREIIRPIPG